MQQICLCGYFVLNWLCGCTHCKFCLIYSVSTICIYSFCNREIGCRCFGGVSRRTAKKTAGCFLLYHSGGALSEAVIHSPLQGRNNQSTTRRFVRGVYFALKRRGLGEWLFYFANIVFIEQVSSLIDAHKSL